MDHLADRAGDLKRMLVDFGTSGRFGRELFGVIERAYPDGQAADEAELTAIMDQFLLQHRLADGTTVVEEFVLAHPEFSAWEGP